jgi:hypothetical protein
MYFFFFFANCTREMKNVNLFLISWSRRSRLYLDRARTQARGDIRVLRSCRIHLLLKTWARTSNDEGRVIYNYFGETLGGENRRRQNTENVEKIARRPARDVTSSSGYKRSNDTQIYQHPSRGDARFFSSLSFSLSARPSLSHCIRQHLSQ